MPPQTVRRTMNPKAQGAIFLQLWDLSIEPWKSMVFVNEVEAGILWCVSHQSVVNTWRNMHDLRMKIRVCTPGVDPHKPYKQCKESNQFEVFLVYIHSSTYELDRALCPASV